MKEPKKTSKKRLSPADKLEQELRRNYIPNQIATALNDILAIEVNALWCTDKVGKKHVMKENDYTEEDLQNVLKKQADNKIRLQKKVDFLKRLFNKQEKAYVQSN